MTPLEVMAAVAELKKVVKRTDLLMQVCCPRFETILILNVAGKVCGVAPAMIR